MKKHPYTYSITIDTARYTLEQFFCNFILEMNRLVRNENNNHFVLITLQVTCFKFNFLKPAAVFVLSDNIKKNNDSFNC